MLVSSQNKMFSFPRVQVLQQQHQHGHHSTQYQSKPLSTSLANTVGLLSQANGNTAARRPLMWLGVCEVWAVRAVKPWIICSAGCSENCRKAARRAPSCTISLACRIMFTIPQRIACNSVVKAHCIILFSISANDHCL